MPCSLDLAESREIPFLCISPILSLLRQKPNKTCLPFPSQMLEIVLCLMRDLLLAGAGVCMNYDPKVGVLTLLQVISPQGEPQEA